MAEFLQRFFRSRPDAPLAAVPEGERVYAIGDIHGRLDLFRAAIAAIESDDAARGPADTTIVLLGDLIDRGPDSSGVIAFARDLSMRRNVRIIAGNHEEIFLASFYKLPVFRNFL
ncbi:MAG: metallophosphoesterase, partial [Geminicoccaceae bacterium]|nr:metallophosphoesterase [Geminicoccaceae bacterium]